MPAMLLKLGREPVEPAPGLVPPGRVLPGSDPGCAPGLLPPAPDPVDREIDGSDGTLGNDDCLAAMLGEPVARDRSLPLSPPAPAPLPAASFIATLSGSATLRWFDRNAK